MKKAQELFHIVSVGLEIAMAFFVLIGIMLSIVNLLFRTNLPGELLAGEIPLIEYLERIFGIVIGLEFMQMLCKPDADNVLEILIFLVARHMVVGETTALEDFISVISICILVIVRRFLHRLKYKVDGEKPVHIFDKVGKMTSNVIHENDKRSEEHV